MSELLDKAEHNRDLREIVTDLREKISHFFHRDSDQSAQKATQYLDTKPDDPINPQGPSVRTIQNSRLEDLKQIIQQSTSKSADKQISTAEIVTQTKTTLTSIAQEGKVESHLGQFFGRLAEQEAVKPGLELPFARFVAQAAEISASNNVLINAEAVTKVAFEVIIGESGKSDETQALLQNILMTLIKTHQLKDDLLAPQLQVLCQKYGFVYAEFKKELFLQKRSAEDREMERAERQETLNSAESLYAMQADILDNHGLQQRDKELMELHVLALTPEKIMDLVAERVSVEALVSKMFSQVHRAGLSVPAAQEARLQQRVNQYFNTVKEDMVLQRSKKMPTSYGGYIPPETTLIKKLRSMDDPMMAAYLMLISQNSFYVKEYLKGKATEAIKEKDVEKVLHSQAEFVNLGDQDLKRHVFRDMRSMFYIQLHANKSQNSRSELAQLYGEIQNDFGAIRTRHEMENEPLKIAGKSIRFGIDEYSQTSVDQVPTLVPNASYKSNVSDVQSLFFNRYSQLEKTFKVFERFVEQAQEGEVEQLIKAAGEMKTADLDQVFAEAPEIKHAMAIFSRRVKQQVALEGGILTPELFRRRDSGYSGIDEESLNAFSASFPSPQLSTEEQEVYMEAGKALAFLSGDLIYTLANALPSMKVDIDRKEVPPAIRRKVINGEMLTRTELRSLEKTLKTLPQDYPFRGLVSTLNYMKFTQNWGFEDIYNMHLLGFVPVTPGKNALNPFDMYEKAQKVRSALFFGVDDSTVQYFQKGSLIPIQEVTRLVPMLSFSRREGWRNWAERIVSDDLVFNPHTNEKEPRSINVPATIDRLLLHSGPTVAMHFLNSPYEEAAESFKEDKGLKKEMTRKIVEHCYHYHPGFFLTTEERRYFRKNEDTFNERLKDYITNDLQEHPTNSVYQGFLSPLEASDEIANQAQPHELGKEHLKEAVRTRRITDRLVTVLSSAETYVAFHKTDLSGPNEAGEVQYYSLVDFFKEPDHRRYQGLKSSIAKGIGYQKRMYAMQGQDDELMKAFLLWGKKTFYSPDSIYHTAKFQGLNKIDNKKKIVDYYSQLISDGVMLNPFDWSYYDSGKLDFQRIGLQAMGRNAKDFNAYLEHMKTYQSTIEKNRDLISSGDQKTIVKGIRENLTVIGKSLKGITGSYGPKNSARAGWMAATFAQLPFIPSRAKDIPIFGDIAPIATWATIMNQKDRYHGGALNMRSRKEILDFMDHMPDSEKVITPYRENELVKGITDEVEIKIPFTNKEVTIKLPKFIARIFPLREHGEFLDLAKEGNFTMESMMKFLKLEKFWRLGNGLLTVLLIGALLVTVQAFQEGFKQLETK